jgi:hypothetical protein
MATEPMPLGTDAEDTAVEFEYSIDAWYVGRRQRLFAHFFVDFRLSRPYKAMRKSHVGGDACL